MVRISALNETSQHNARNLPCPTFEQSPFTGPISLRNSKVALLSSAGLMERGGENVAAKESTFRVVDNSIADKDLLINHISVNFDRSAYMRNVNSVLPRDRLAEMANAGLIESTASHSYSVMGAVAPEMLMEHVPVLAADMQNHGIDAVCLLPV